MKKLALLFSLLMVLLTMGCATGKNTPVRSPTPLIDHIGDSTVALVRIVGDEENGYQIRPFCTGVWLSGNEILTAGHCVAHDEEGGGDPVDAKVYYVIQKEVKEVLDDPAAIHLAKVVAFDGDHDLALIKAEAGGIPTGHGTADLAAEMPGLGEHVWMVGHPRGMYWSYAEGTISAYRSDTTVGKAVQVNGTVWYGNSGGGVFDSQGNLLGVCSRLTRVPMMNYFVHLDSVKKFVKEYHEPKEDLGKK
jgi:S1-C subfamily serine protease